MDKSIIINSFPKLATDKSFKISSPEDPNYNCIAWAYKLYKDRWMQPPGGITFGVDGITWWPDGVENGMNIECLVNAFKQIGYEKCSTWEHESDYQKVALYYDPKNQNWTHAARESRTGNFWMSKLGPSHDIHHENPYTIEGKYYGEVFCIMKIEDK